MDFKELLKTGADYVKKDLGEKQEKYDMALEEAERLDDRQLCRRWRRCSDVYKRAAFQTEIKNRGISPKEIRSYIE